VIQRRGRLSYGRSAKCPEGERLSSYILAGPTGGGGRLSLGPIKITRQTPSPCFAKTSRSLRHQGFAYGLLHSQVRRCAMAIMDANYDQEMMRLWGIISDLSDQLNEHRATASALRNRAEGIKVSLRPRMNEIRGGSSHTKRLSALEPSHSHSNRFRVAQVCVCDWS